MRYALVVNPNAGKKNGRAVSRDVIRLLGEAGHAAQEFVSRHQGETRSIAASLEPADWDGVIAIGGDGTFFEVINGVLADRTGSPVPVGQIPVGTGNSFVRDLGVFSVTDGVAAIAGDRRRRIDLGSFSCDAGEYYFANLLGAGFVSNVARRARRFKALGSLAYVLGVVGEVIGLEASFVTIEIDGEKIEREAIFVEVCNSRYTGGEMMMAPGASIDDGLLDVVVASKMSRRTVLGLLPKIFPGRHVGPPRNARGVCAVSLIFTVVGYLVAPFILLQALFWITLQNLTRSRSRFDPLIKLLCRACLVPFGIRVRVTGRAATSPSATATRPRRLPASTGLPIRCAAAG